SQPARPNAARVAQSLTRLLEGNDNPEYSRLRNDFRLSELAKVLAFKEVGTEFFNYLLKDFKMREVETKKFVTGIRRVETGQVVCNGEVGESRGKVDATRLELSNYKNDFRGGVEGDVKVEAHDFSRPANQLEQL